jgi:hypothetical protein
MCATEIRCFQKKIFLKSTGDVSFRENSFQESVLTILVPKSTSIVVKPLKDAEGICKAMAESYGKL